MPENLRRSYAKICRLLENTPSIKSLQAIRGLNSEPYKDRYSVRINKGRRLEFDYDDSGNIIVFTLYDANNHYEPNF